MCLKLQALVYDILPSTTAVFSYAIGPRKLSANEQFFCWCSNRSNFATNNSNYIIRLFYNWPCCLRQLKKNQNRLNRDGTLFLPGVDASHVYVRAWALGCFHSLIISTQTFRRALHDRVAGQLRGDKECPFSGVTKSGRVWRNVPESDVRSVPRTWTS